MNKRMLAMLLSIVMLLGILVPVSLASPVSEEEFPYPQSEEGLAGEPLGEEPDVLPRDLAEDGSNGESDEPGDGASQDEPVGNQDVPPSPGSGSLEQEEILTDLSSEPVPSNESDLFDKLMACKTFEEMGKILDNMTDDEWDGFTEEQKEKVEELFLKLEPEVAPTIVMEESEPPVKSEIVFPAVNFTNVAPFLDAVVGGN